MEVGSANYVAGYALKKVMGSKNKDYYRDLGIIPPRALMSRRPGIGAEFMEKFAEPIKRLLSCTVNGQVVAAPRYYRDKLGFKEQENYQAFIDERKEREWQKAMERSGMTVEELQAHIKSYLEVEQQYRYLENYHNSLVKGKLK